MILIDKINTNDTIEKVLDDCSNQFLSGDIISSLQAAVCLNSLCYINNIKSGIIVTDENIDGNVKPRYSIAFYNDYNNEYVVANPIEDIKALSGLDDHTKSMVYIFGDTRSIINGDKKESYTKFGESACYIPVKDFIKNYGKGKALFIGNPFDRDIENETFNDMLNDGVLVKNKYEIAQELRNNKKSKVK